MGISKGKVVASMAFLLQTTAGRVVSTLGILTATAVTAVTIGASANFTSGGTGATPVTTGRLALTVGTTGTGANRLSVAATDVMPGDSIERAVDVINGSSYNLTSVTMGTTASGGTALSTDTTNGLQLKVDSCSVAWTETSNSPRSGYSYTCGGTLTNITTSSPLVAPSRNLGSAILVAGTTVHYRITMTLPSSADNSFQNLSTVVTHTFDTAQPSAGNR